MVLGLKKPSQEKTSHLRLNYDWIVKKPLPEGSRAFCYALIFIAVILGDEEQLFNVPRDLFLRDTNHLSDLKSERIDTRIGSDYCLNSCAET